LKTSALTCSGDLPVTPTVRLNSGVSLASNYRL